MGYVSKRVRFVRSLTKPEQAKILKVSGEHRDDFRDHMLISMALGTALREGELVALNVGDVVKNGKALSRFQLRTFAKKGRRSTKKVAPTVQARIDAAAAKHQTVFVPKLVRRKLEKFIGWKKREQQPVGPDAPLFASGPIGRRDGKVGRLTTRTVRWLFRQMQERAGFETFYGFHELRHTCLTNLYGATKDLVLVRRHARHRDVTTTEIYAHVSDDEAMREIDKLTA